MSHNVVPVQRNGAELIEATEASTERAAAADCVLGFGCATLYGLPSRRDRRAVVETAYDLGIRHFDVAPMYGLGIAESELGDFAVAHPDVRIATKFGIEPTRLGYLAGHVQPPVRRVLQRSTSLRQRVKRAGGGPGSGAIGRLLYRPRNYTVRYARHRLDTSLRALRTDRLSHFMLHEPAGASLEDRNELVEFLERERDGGRIGSWGLAGNLSRMDAALALLSRRAPLLQMPYDLISGHCGPCPAAGQATVVYGVVAGALQRVRDALTQHPQLERQCNELLDADLADGSTLVRLLIRDAVRQNMSGQRTGGTVLISSTKPRHLELLCSAARAALPHEAEVADLIRRTCRDTSDEK
ncbi:aldo/keto reductase [Mycobacterium sp. GA-2829]|uniref:aldo/keto reductase n=1 Tax=Mycobacterium sp. GA-2829 TaxID=1772283 RepID=UPI0018D210C0|nr:aldo/keto reductase [Mycobacterium sp. GA-2829]